MLLLLAGVLNPLAQKLTSGGQTMSRNMRGGLVAVLAGVLFAVAACGSSTGSGGVAGTTSSPAASAPPAASPSGGSSPSAAGSGAALNQALLQFQTVGGSSITGGAILTDLGDGTTAVTIGVVAAGVTEPMPAELAPGTCADMTAGGGASASPGASGASPAASAAASPAASAAASPAASGAASPSGEPGPVTAGPNGEYKLNDLNAGSSNTVIGTGLDALLGTPSAIVIHMSAADMSAVACADVKR
jgi:hypothetical protein